MSRSTSSDRRAFNIEQTSHWETIVPVPSMFPFVHERSAYRLSLIGNSSWSPEEINAIWPERLRIFSEDIKGAG